TWCASSTRRSIVVVPGLKEVVQGSTCATSSRPRVSAWRSFACLPDEPRKMRGLSIRSTPAVPAGRSARPELPRARAHESPKRVGEVAGILEACRQAGLEHGTFRVSEGLLGAFDPLRQNVLMGRATDASAEELRKIVGAHPRDVGELLEAEVPRQVSGDVVEN